MGPLEQQDPFVRRRSIVFQPHKDVLPSQGGRRLHGQRVREEGEVFWVAKSAHVELQPHLQTESPVRRRWAEMIRLNSNEELRAYLLKSTGANRSRPKA